MIRSMPPTTPYTQYEEIIQFDAKMRSLVVTGDQNVAAIHTVGEQVPSFEDLLFRAENFDF